MFVILPTFPRDRNRCRSVDAAAAERLSRRAPLAAPTAAPQPGRNREQDHLIGPGRTLWELIEADRLSSVILRPRLLRR